MRCIPTFVLVLFIFGCSVRPPEADRAGIPVTPHSSLGTTTIEPQEPGVECENTNGIIGFAEISFNGTTVLRFYEQPKTTAAPAQILRFYEDRDLKMDSFKAEGKKAYSLLRPEVHKLDYYLFDLAVRTRNNGWLEVIVDNQSDETLWLPEGKIVKFENWLQKMKSSFAVGRRTKENNPLRIGPDLNTEEVGFLGDDCFRVVEMEGNWIKVNIASHCSDAPKQTVSGWIRWRDENSCLMVEIFPFA